MPAILPAALLLVLALGASAPLRAAETGAAADTRADAEATMPAEAAAAQATAPVSTIAAPVREADGAIKPGWLARHEEYVARAKAGEVGLLFLGDSLTYGWNSVPELWQREFGQWSPANFGIGGDRTQNLLWRITHGELAGIHPRVVVLLIGTNNIGDESANVAAGVAAVVGAVRSALPESRILLLGLFPRGTSYWDGGRRITRNANTLIAKLHDGVHVHYLDLTDRFVQPDQTLLKTQFPDNLHPSPAGYQIWADAMRPLLTTLLAKP